MKTPPVLAHQRCPQCGAYSQDKVGRCWLCFEAKEQQNPYAATVVPMSTDSLATEFTAWDKFFAVLLGICVVMTILVGIGLAVQDRGMLIPFAILAGPPYLVTIVRGYHRVSVSKPLKPAGLLITLIVSAVGTVLVLHMLAFALFAVLFLLCISGAIR
jgi:hypothetical protein